MLSAYYDESGTDRLKSSALTVAGYISTVEMWTKFQIEWQKLLDDEHLEMFHMTDLECFHGEFTVDKGWNKKRQIAVIKRAHDTIKRNTLKGIESSLLWSAYDELIPTYAGKHPPPAYALLVNVCMVETAAWARRNGYNEPINYVFEDGVKGVGWVADVVQHATKFPEIKELLFFRSFSYADKKDVIQLQVADVNAYKSWKQIENRYVKGNLRDIRKSTMNLKEKDGGIWSYYLDHEILPRLLSDLAKVDYE